jgi:predicted membrane protein
MNKNSFLNPRIIIGIIFIALGTLFLLDNYNLVYFELPDFIFEWQMIFIIIGIILLITAHNKTAGVIFLFIGLFNYYPELWPLIFVIIGLLIIYRRSLGRRFFKKHIQGKFDSSESVEEDFEDISIFGGGTRNYYSDNFKGGRVVSIFGGSEIRLTDCKLAEGDNYLEITALFGGNTILVPRDWNVQIDVMPIFGGFGDKRLKDPNMVFDTGRKLIIKGTVIFGGGELKSF